MTPLIAERALTIDRPDGRQQGFVRLHAPEQRDASYWCTIHISWPGFEQETSIGGADSYQALILAMKIVPTLIAISDDFKAGHLHEFDSPDSLSDLAFSFGFAPVQGKPQ